MNAKAVWWLLAGLAGVAGAGLVVQRAQLAPLQTELAARREQQREIARWRERNEKLVAAQVPEEERLRLRADRQAIERLRRELVSLRAKVGVEAWNPATETAERFAAGVDVPATDWRNAGGATPQAALETVLWAAAGGEIDAFARRIRFDAAARTLALEYWQSLPPAERARHASPEHLMAMLSVSDVPIGTATVTNWTKRTEEVQTAELTLADSAGRTRGTLLMFVREGAEWKLRATEAAVARYVSALRGPLAAGK